MMICDQDFLEKGVIENETKDQEKDNCGDHIRQGTHEELGTEAGHILQDRRSHY